jgi:riboflavin transporter FmnP
VGDNQAVVSVILGAEGSWECFKCCAAAAAAAAAAAGGIAGACTILGLFVPLYCLVGGFGLKEATALSQAAIAGVHAFGWRCSSEFWSCFVVARESGGSN